jgi:hypothetical protein
MSTKNSEQVLRKRNLFQLIDSFVPANIQKALKLLEHDRGLHQACKHRYFPLMRLIDPVLGGGFELLYAISEALRSGGDEGFLEAFVAHYAVLGAPDIVDFWVRKHPDVLTHISSCALLNMAAQMDLPQAADIWDIALRDEGKLLLLPPPWRALSFVDRLALHHAAHFQAFAPHLPTMTFMTQFTAQACQLARLPEAVGELAQLEILRLPQNLLAELPTVIGRLGSLRWLDVSDNQLMVLPDWVGDMSSLTILNVQGNALQDVAVSIFQMPSLQQLFLQGNKLTDLGVPMGVVESALETLCLSHNPLEDFPEGILSFARLTRLELNACGLRALPAGISKLSNLMGLSLRNNPLDRLPDEICALTRLQSLDLRGCKLTELPADIGKMEGLETMDLRGTIIQNFPPSMQSLSRLRSLRLDAPMRVAMAPQLSAVQAWLPNCCIDTGDGLV